MFKFSISSGVLNGLLKRLSSVSGGDPTASITFILEESSLKIYYESKIEKTDIPCMFFEAVPITSSDGSGSASILTRELAGIKVTEFTKESKFPHTKEVEFKFSTSVLNTNWEVFYSAEHKSKLKLAHAILEVDKDISAYDKLHKDRANFVEVESSKLDEAIANCNLFKADATSREGNGCLLEVIGSDFVLIGTDSIMAAKYQAPVVQHTLEKHFSLVLSNAILSLMKNFITDTEQVKLASSRSSLFLESQDRSMVVSTLNVTYDIPDPGNFFKVGKESTHVGSVGLSPIISAVNTLTHLSTDVHNKVYVQVAGDKLNLKTDKNSSENLPATILNEVQIKVNGRLLTSSLQKLSSLDAVADLYFNKLNNRITFSSPDERLIFLIQGMNV